MQTFGRLGRCGVLGIVVAASAALRLACLRNDLWFDEIWSLKLVAIVHSPIEILTRLHSGNNHPLNSLWMYALGPSAPEWAYRLLSWTTGAATVGLAGAIARRQFVRMHPKDTGDGADAAGLITALLFGGSYMLVLYSSEARGYAPAVFFSLLAFYALLRGQVPKIDPARNRINFRDLTPFVYGLACILGLLAHAVSAQIVIAGFGFSAIVALRAAGPWRTRASGLLLWHAVPCIFLGLYFICFFRRLDPGGATFAGVNHVPLAGVFGDLAAFSLGFPASLGLAVAMPVLLAVTAAGLVLVFFRSLPLATFYALAVFVTPLPGILSANESVLFPRFFILSVACALLLSGYFLARAWMFRAWARPLCASAVGLFLIGGGFQAWSLLLHGRGEYLRALRYVVAQTPTPDVTVSTDFSEFRNFLLIDRYGKAAAGPGRSIRYLPSRRWRAPGPEWIFVERLDNEPDAPGHLYDSHGTYYQLERVFPHAPLSGWTWFVYRNTLLLGFPPPPGG